jgi:hypothetical protein
MGDGIGETDRELNALRERMHQLESIDSVIAESVRRSRALLDEAQELRDRARRELNEARAEIDRDRAELVAIARRILGDSSPPIAAPVAYPVQLTSEPTAAISGPETNYSIIVQGVTRPAVATGLRAHLMAQPGITAVDPREFAEGVLRLQVVSSVPIADGHFLGWKDGDGLTLLAQPGHVIEIVLPGA